MFLIKKTVASVLALSSGMLFAGAMGPVCTPGNVTVPCERNAWEIGGSALYIQPIHSGALGYYGTRTVGTFTSYNRIDDDWDWGFFLEAGYHFNAGNDFNLNWSHVDTSGGHYYTTDFRRVQNKWDEVNAELGQWIDFNPNSGVRLHGGVQFSRVKSDVYPITTTTGNYNSDYNGFGPRAGADLNYKFVKGFSIYAKGAAAILVGTSRFTDGINSITGSKDEIVPQFETKLGVNYTYAMSQGDVTLDVGYMWFDYLSALQQTRSVTNTNAGVFASDFAASGPYFGLKYVGNA